MSRASCAFSNRSDEDDLPPDLAEAVGVSTTTTTNGTTAAATTPVAGPLVSPKIHKISSPQNSEGKSQLSPGAKVWENSPEEELPLLGIQDKLNVWHPCAFKFCIINSVRL